MPETKKKKAGRPKKHPEKEFDVIDEQSVEKLEMSKKEDDNKIITIEDLGHRYKQTYDRVMQADSHRSGEEDARYINATAMQYNKLNPFLQNQRIKNLYSGAKEFDKAHIIEFLQNPGAHENELRSLSWSQSGAQQIYYNILRRAADIPQYKYYVTPPLMEKESEYDDQEFKNEDALVHDWLQVFNVPTTLKTMALQVKREGKQSYILRNKFSGEGKNKKTAFAAFQKLPTDWIKLVGIGQNGFLVSFNMMYFMDMANSPSDFGEYMVKAWNDIVTKGVVYRDEKGAGAINYDLAKDYSFTYDGTSYSSMIEQKIKGKKAQSYFFWLRLPSDMCFTFGSDNSNPWVAPDTMGLLQKLQELSDYGKLAGLIASTPLTAVLTGEIETIPNPRAGKNESVFSPEVIQGYQDMFNAVTSTNVEAWMWPAKNIKLQQLNADVNSSDIVTKATQNFVTSAGEGGLTITTDKPNVSQIKTAQLLAASQQRYLTLQFERALNFIIRNKLGFKYDWTLHIWGDIFSFENEKKYLKELVAGGATFLLPKLASAEDLSLRDTKAIMSYIKTLDFYKDFSTWTSAAKAEEDAKSAETAQVGRPALDESDIENESTAASRDAGDNTAENRDTMTAKCPICGAELEDGQIVCESCREKINEEE